MNTFIKWFSNIVLVVGFGFFGSHVVEALGPSPITVDAKAALVSVISVALVSLMICCVVTSFSWRRVEA
jgi:hypothetical protein